MGDLTKHFSKHEFACKCGCGTVIVDEFLLAKFSWARVHADIPFVFNSATRCPKHNSIEGGVGNSSHLTGKAVDIRVRNHHERFRILAGLFNAGFTRIKATRSFIHVDVDGSKTQEWFGL